MALTWAFTWSWHLDWHTVETAPPQPPVAPPPSWTPVWPRPSSALRRSAHQARQRDCPAAESGSLGPQENENTLRKQTLFRPRTARAPPSQSHSFLVSLFVFTLNVSFRSKDAQGAVCWPLLTVITANWYENYFKVWKLARSDRIKTYPHTYIWFIQYQKKTFTHFLLTFYVEWVSQEIWEQAGSLCHVHFPRNDLFHLEKHIISHCSESKKASCRRWK